MACWPRSTNRFNSYVPEFQAAGLAMVRAQGSIFGWVAPSAALIGALAAAGLVTQTELNPNSR